MRLFTGIDLDLVTRDSIGNLIDGFRKTADLQWSPVGNLHITTKFLGEYPPEKLTEVKTALARVPVSGPLNIRLRGLGWFPNPHNPRSFWVGIDAGDTIAVLAKATNVALSEIGIALESKPFSPHLTLARIRAQETNLRPLRAAIAGLPSVEFGTFVAPSFHLYLSELHSTGSSYTKIAEFPLSILSI